MTSPHSIPYYIRDTQSWAVDQERYRHAEALYWVGEPAVVTMLWHVVDYEAGLCERCHTCFSSSDLLENRVSHVYDQPTRNKCPECFGSSFSGYRARIVRPFVFADVTETEKQNRRGSVHPEAMTGETTGDFRVYEGDYVFRADGSRWRLTDRPRQITLRSGYAYPFRETESIGHAQLPLGYEEPTTVAYLVPPSKASLRQLAQPSRLPGYFSVLEQIHGPLIPETGYGD
jgi:hypothetical protein